MNAQTLHNIKKYVVDRFSGYKDRQHSMDHTLRVVDNAKKIIKTLGMEREVDTNLLYASCYLHDILITNKKSGLWSSLDFHFFEKKINKKHLPTIVKKFSVSEKESQILINAIINHPYSIPSRTLNRNSDIYSKILQDADSIDYVSNERLKRFNKKRKYLFLFSNFYIYLIRKNIKYFLNFPELAKYIDRF